jgi:hypothetical protein
VQANLAFRLNLLLSPDNILGPDVGKLPEFTAEQQAKCFTGIGAESETVMVRLSFFSPAPRCLSLRTSAHSSGLHGRTTDSRTTTQASWLHASVLARRHHARVGNAWNKRARLGASRESIESWLQEGDRLRGEDLHNECRDNARGQQQGVGCTTCGQSCCLCGDGGEHPG